MIKTIKSRSIARSNNGLVGDSSMISSCLVTPPACGGAGLIEEQEDEDSSSPPECHAGLNTLAVNTTAPGCDVTIERRKNTISVMSSPDLDDVNATYENRNYDDFSSQHQCLDRKHGHDEILFGEDDQDRRENEAECRALPQKALQENPRHGKISGATIQDVFQEEDHDETSSNSSLGNDLDTAYHNYYFSPHYQQQNHQQEHESRGEILNLVSLVRKR